MANGVLNDKVVLVTGASAGIGLAVCRQLVAAGARVVMVARTAATLERAAASLGDADRAIPIPLDVGDLAALERLPAKVVARCGRLDVVVNNAGVHHRGAVATRSTADLAAMVNVNLTAPIVLTRAALDVLPRGGVVVNVASLSGYVPLPGAATYSATKAGMRWFARAVDDELRERGIAVRTVSPGPVDTDFFLGELDRVAPMTFSQPMSKPEEVAGAVIQAILEGPQEIGMPKKGARLATLGYLSPGFLRFLRPRLERKGAKAKAAYAARRRGPTGSQP